jgi:hypothetical protein
MSGIATAMNEICRNKSIVNSIQFISSILLRYMLFIDIVLHTFIIFLIQSALYMFFISELEQNEVNKLIAKKINCLLYNTNPDYVKQLQTYLPNIDFPQTCVSYDNANWITIIVISIITYLFLVIISILFVKLYYPETNITYLVIKNIVFFTFIGLIEYYFFINVVIKYNVVFFSDIENTTFLTFKTGKVQS